LEERGRKARVDYTLRRVGTKSSRTEIIG